LQPTGSSFTLDAAGTPPWCLDRTRRDGGLASGHGHDRTDASDSELRFREVKPPGRHLAFGDRNWGRRRAHFAKLLLRRLNVALAVLSLGRACRARQLPPLRPSQAWLTAMITDCRSKSDSPGTCTDSSRSAKFLLDHAALLNRAVSWASTCLVVEAAIPAEIFLCQGTSSTLCRPIWRSSATAELDEAILVDLASPLLRRLICCQNRSPLPARCRDRRQMLSILFKGHSSLMRDRACGDSARSLWKGFPAAPASTTWWAVFFFRRDVPSGSCRPGRERGCHRIKREWWWERGSGV